MFKKGEAENSPKNANMKNWKIYIIVCFVFIPIFMFGQKDKSQELVELLNNGDFFRSRSLYLHICDTISPDIDLYYKFRMAQFSNKKDSAAIYLERIFTDYPDLFGKEIINVYGILLDLYIDLRDIDKGIHIYECANKYLKENPYHIDEKELSQWYKDTEYRLDQLKRSVQKPSISIKRNKKNDSVKILGALKPLFTARYNNVPLKTFFDTGAQSYCVMNSMTANRLGIKYATDKINQETINKKILANKALVDSIEIGNITLYNIPIIIYEQKLPVAFSDLAENHSKEIVLYDSIYSCLTTPITIGLPLMQLIGKFQVDNENKNITFPVLANNVNTLKESNIYTYKNNLYMRLKVNEKDFTGYLDTGANIFIDIDTTFYKRNQNSVQADTVTAKPPYTFMSFHENHNDIPYVIPYKPIIKFENKLVRVLKKRAVKIYPLSVWDVDVFDGLIGYDFFKRLGKRVLLDFDNMRLEIAD